MKTRDNDYLIDKLYLKYKTLSKNEKLAVNYSLVVILMIFAVNGLFKAGENFGEFLYIAINYSEKIK